MNTFSIAEEEHVLSVVDDRTRRILEQRGRTASLRRRGWFVRRALVAADVLGLLFAFLIAELAFIHQGGDRSHVPEVDEYLIFLSTLPVWIVMAKLYGLYDRDEERADHTTADDMTDVFHLVTVGVWLFFGVTALTHIATPSVAKFFAFWALAIAFVALSRIVARTLCRHHITYLQNTVIVGAGDVGQLIARKLLAHREYGLNLVGFVDDNPKDRREDLSLFTLLGSFDDLPNIVKLLDVERVIFAFLNASHEEHLALIRSLDDLGVQVDIVPRLFEAIAPTTEMHTVEGLPMLSLRQSGLSPSWRLLKRTVDVVCASVALILCAPVFLLIAWRIGRDSPGPVFFRQTRLGMNMKEFTVFKFRTMNVDTTSQEHEEFIRKSANGVVSQETNGLFKLERGDVVTRPGQWLRRTSMDELPQLINVLRGEMSLVGPRPCLPYEIEHFAPHHFERFAVPAGITGLWQVTARAHGTFREALELDVAYVRGWSFGLDLRLLFRTPVQLLGRQGTR